MKILIYEHQISKDIVKIIHYNKPKKRYCGIRVKKPTFTYVNPNFEIGTKSTTFYIDYEKALRIEGNEIIPNLAYGFSLKHCVNIQIDAHTFTKKDNFDEKMRNMYYDDKVNELLGAIKILEYNVI